MKARTRKSSVRSAVSLLLACISWAAADADSARDPMTVLNALADRIYVSGETSGNAADMIAAEADAAGEIRRYVASGSTDGLVAKEKGEQSPLAAAAYMGYPNVVAALLTSGLVRAHINDVDEMGVTPWIAANLSMRQSLWTCNPATFDDLFKFVPMFVTQPYYLSNPVPPYAKAREVLARAGATVDMAKAKTLWLTNCKNASDGAKAKVQASIDLQKTVQELGVADLTTQIVKLRMKAGNGNSQTAPGETDRAKAAGSPEVKAAQCISDAISQYATSHKSHPEPATQKAALADINAKCRAQYGLATAPPEAAAPAPGAPAPRSDVGSDVGPAPLSPNARTQLVEITNQYRHSLGLPDIAEGFARSRPAPTASGSASDVDPLADLVKSGSIERLQKFLSSPGADINHRSGSDEALLDYAADQNAVTVARFLIEHGARAYAMQTNLRSQYGMTALHRAAIADAAEVAELLLTHAAVDAPNGVSANVGGPLGVRPLILAASNGSTRTAAVLLNHGADISVRSNLSPGGQGKTALSEATAHGYLDIVRLILIHVPVPNSQNMNAVAARGDLEAMRLMVMHDELVHDVPPSAKNDALRFVLTSSNLFEDRKEMVELLLADGADINNRLENAANTPVMFSLTPEMLEFLIAHGADPNAETPYGNVAEAITCDKRVADPVGIIKVLYEHGVDVARPSKRGMTVMQCAVATHHPELAAYLRSQGVPADATPGR